jgi:hypothetical protein
MLPLGVKTLDACSRQGSWCYGQETANGHFPADFDQGMAHWFVVDRDPELAHVDDRTAEDITRSYND